MKVESIAASLSGPAAIRASEGRNAMFGGMAVVVILAIAGFFALRAGLTNQQQWLEFVAQVIAEGRNAPVPFAVGVLFALVFAAIVIKLLVDSVSLLRFGVTTLQLDPYPGSVGGHVGGTLRLGYRLQPDDKTTVTVVCWRHYVRCGKNKSESRCERFWSDDVQPEVLQQFGQLSLRFTVTLPANLPASGKLGEDTYRWQVIVRLDRKGRDIVRSFEVPVSVEGGARQAAQPMRTDAQASADARIPGLAISHSDGGLQVRGLSGRNARMNLSLLLFGAVFGSAGIFLGYGVAFEKWQSAFRASHDGIGRVFDVVFATMSSLMALVFAAVGLLFIVLAIASARNRREFRIANSRLTTRNRDAGEDIELNQVERFEVSESGSMGTSTIHDFHALTRDDRRIAILEGVPGKIAAKRVSQLLEQFTGKTVQELSRAERKSLSRLNRRRNP